MTVLRALTMDPTVARTGDGRTIEVRLVTYNTQARVTDDGGRTFYQESFAPGSVRCEVDAPVYVEVPRSLDPHRDAPPLVGRIVGYRSTADGCYADVRIADSIDGRDLLALVDEKVMRHVSIEFDAPSIPTAGRSAGPVVHTSATVTGLLFTNRPQAPGADILGRRSQGDPTMTEVATPEAPAPVAPVAPAPVVEPAPTALRAVPGVTTLPPPALPGDVLNRMPEQLPPVVSRFRSFGEFVHAASFGSARVSIEERETVYRALSQATTADATGLIQTQWIARIIDLVRKYTPVIESFDQGPLPDKGLTISIPKVTQRPVIAKQAAQGGVVGGQKVIIAPVNYTVDPYGGGQEMSVTVMQRSEPAYLDQVMRLYAIEMARQLETAVATALWTASSTVNAAIEMGNTDALIAPAFTAACLPFLNGLDRLPEFALLNTVMWQKMANAVGTDGRPLFPTVSPFNPVGTVSLTTPEGSVRDLHFRVAPKMGGATARAVVGVPEAWVTMIDSIQTLQVDVPETLIHQMSVFEFAAFGVTDATGLQTIVDLV